MPTGKALNETDRATIAKFYGQGMDVKELAYEYDVAIGTIYNIAAEFGVSRGKQSLIDMLDGDVIEEMLERYNRGDNVQALCAEHNVSVTAFYSMLREMGLSPRSYTKHALEGREMQYDLACQMYEDGWVVWFIEQETGLHQPQIYRELRKRGIETRGKGVAGLVPKKDEEGNYILESVDGRTPEDFQKHIEEIARRK